MVPLSKNGGVQPYKVPRSYNNKIAKNRVGMLRSVKAFLVSATLITGSLLSWPATSQDASVQRNWKERVQERRQQKEQAVPDAEASATPIRQPGHYNYAIRHGGHSRSYRLYVPKSLDHAKPIPLLVVLHGGGGSMNHQADDERYGLISKSEQEGFLVVFPNGYSRLGGSLSTWNAGKCCGAARDKDIDDVGFIRQLVTNVSRQFNIDRGRIFAVGMSNGGMMAYRLACEMSDIFKAVASVAGTDNTDKCSATAPVSVLHIHARDDTHVLFYGGAGSPLRKSAVTDFMSVPDTVAKWTRLNRCPVHAHRLVENEGAFCDLYSPCASHAKVQLCVTPTGGHTWPGVKKARAEPASQAISANDIMWNFFNSL